MVANILLEDGEGAKEEVIVIAKSDFSSRLPFNAVDDAAVNGGASVRERVKPGGGRPAVSLSFQAVASADIPIDTSEPARGGVKRLERPRSALATIRDTQTISSTPDLTKSNRQGSAKKRVQLQRAKPLLHPPIGGVSAGFFQRSNAPARPSSAPPLEPEDLAESRKLQNSAARLRSIVVDSTGPHPRSSKLLQKSLLSDIGEENSGLFSTWNLKDSSSAWDDASKLGSPSRRPQSALASVAGRSKLQPDRRPASALASKSQTESARPTSAALSGKSTRPASAHTRPSSAVSTASRSRRTRPGSNLLLMRDGDHGGTNAEGAEVGEEVGAEAFWPDPCPVDLSEHWHSLKSEEELRSGEQPKVRLQTLSPCCPRFLPELSDFD
jgi:hypothetical protein